MAAVIWNHEKMSTGVDGVDAQHQEWIRRYNEFDDAIAHGHGLETVQAALDFFIEYADTHFKYEERVMDERHCAAAHANRAEHDHMRNILKGYQSYVKKHGYTLADIIGLKLQMEDWLIKHILTIDIQLRDS
jgi:hemerythrin